MPTMYERRPHGSQLVVSGPLSVASSPPMIIVANTTTPTRNCICRSFMTGKLIANSLLLHFRKSFTRFAADKLGDAFVLRFANLSRRAVEDDLRFGGLQPAERVKHHDAIGHLLRSLHIMCDDNARHRV